jgi:hypothetical protein
MKSRTLNNTLNLHLDQNIMLQCHHNIILMIVSTLNLEHIVKVL